MDILSGRLLKIQSLFCRNKLISYFFYHCFIFVLFLKVQTHSLAVVLLLVAPDVVW